MFRICIIDDDKIHTEKTKDILNTIFTNKQVRYTIEEYHTINEIKKIIDDNQFDYHCVLLDIQFDNQTSLSLADIINNKYPSCYIIYITSYLEYSRHISRTNYSYFIYKKDLQKELPLAMQKVINQMNHSSLIQIPVNGKTILVDSRKIMYIESHLHKVRIICTDEVIEPYKKIDEMLSILQVYPDFIRCHTSYIINAQYIKEYSTTNITMTNHVNISITRKYKDIVKNFLNQYFNPFLKV